MKILYFQEETYEAERIVKNADSIVGYVSNNVVFEFRGILDFEGFTLADGQAFDEQGITLEQLEQENKLLKLQNQANAERIEFMEDLI
ncbi:hypothetical protein A0U40_00685 [[Bacillus] sp. KCTC 13219]|nr:hypothetical protein A0U40_00685 [[Bacillus] sp. KCTC 13219]